jgi:hypothetical protein
LLCRAQSEQLCSMSREWRLVSPLIVARLSVAWRHMIAIVMWRFQREGQPSRLFAARGLPSMCDYSLHNVASRPAKVGDKLVTTKFDFLTRGFAAIGEPNVAVCLLPGTEVAFEKEVERDHAFDRLLLRMRFGKLGDKVARFRQVNMNRPNVHASRRPGVPRRADRAGHPPVRRPARNRAAVASVRARRQRSAGADARFSRRVTRVAARSDRLPLRSTARFLKRDYCVPAGRHSRVCTENLLRID